MNDAPLPEPTASRRSSLPPDPNSQSAPTQDPLPKIAGQTGELPSIRITSFTSAPLDHQSAGLLGWLSVEISGLILVDGVALRRTGSDGRLALSFPSPRDRQGRRRRVVRPRSDQARREIERRVFFELGIEELQE